MEKWRLLNLEFKDPILNMAIEESILLAVNEGVSPNTIRFWKNIKSVVIGRSQNIADEVNVEACKRYGVKILRRLTGGGTVYQDLGNLNWTFVISCYSKLYPKTLSDLYYSSCRVVIEGLKYLGLDAEFKPPGSILVRDKKVSGSAAYFKKNAALCHGTLLIDANLTILSKVLSRPRYQVTNIKNELKKHKFSSVSTIQRTILRGFKKLYQIEVELGKLSEYEIELFRLLYKKKYKKNSWNLKGMTP
jgi:lipoate-protein ligase A